ncbi:MAG: 23S rRNA (uracil(1939)-C(5))-methyltransferase RlmD [Planctomycetes bacterium]|nr:23S rRNA (uracil(1939)-C(5))-methyltransferase RlmD [Planctomycetota bacterium]
MDHEAEETAATARVRRGQALELAVESLNPAFEGVASHASLQVLVPRAFPGDRVRARVISVKPGYARALVEEVLSPSPDRVEAPCPIAGECGGCPLMPLSYEAQLAARVAVVRDALGAQGEAPPLEAEHLVRFRGKAVFPVARRGRRSLVGFYAPRSHRIVPVETCPVQGRHTNRAYAALREHLLGRLRLHAYDERKGTGLLRYLVFRESLLKGHVLVGLVTTEALDEGLGREVLALDPSIVGVVNNVNAARGNAIFGPGDRTLAGKDHVVEGALDVRFRIGLRAFYQVNPRQAERLYAEVRERVAASGARAVVDAYAGVGGIALTLARTVARVVAIEREAESVRWARSSAELNGIENVEFEEGDVAEVLPHVLERLGAGLVVPLVILDPPRQGCDPAVLEALAAAEVPSVVYISCNPETLRRDVGRLRERGYRVVHWRVADLFPHAAHVEVLAELRLNDPGLR